MKLQQFIGVLCLFLLSQPLLGGDLTPEQIETLRLKLTQVKTNLDGHISNRNQGARSVFIQASSSPRAALNLYLNCYKKVHYEMEGRSDTEFRVWKNLELEKKNPKLSSKAFSESLMIMLRYLALSCHAAEVEELDEVFVPLSNYVEGLSHLKEMPEDFLTKDVSNSVFVKAYHVESLLSQNDNWESVPFNIPGIYEKVILPHIRANNPQNILNVWDKRIEQEKRLVLFLEKKKGEALRGLSRQEKVKKRDNQNGKGGGKGGNIMKSHDLDDFNRDTYPWLQWNRMKDMYKYVDQMGAAKQMLTFVEAKLTTPNGEAFYQDFIGVLTAAANSPTETTTP